MKSLTISGNKRVKAGKSANYQLRSQGFVPCNLYGEKAENIEFSVFQADFKDLVYSPDTFKVELDIDGERFTSVLQEIQFHPLSEEIIHADFVRISDDKPIKIQLPINFTGNSTGVRAGGKLIKKLRNLKVKGIPAELPDFIEVDITELDLGKSIKVSEISAGNLEILNSPNNPVATVEIPRGLRGKTEEAATPGKKK